MLTLWKPLDSLLRFDRFFDDVAPQRWSEGFGWSPRVDVKEDEKALTVTAELPGVDQKDVSVELKDGVLSISGEKKAEKEEKNETYYRVERSYGSFCRSFYLDEKVDAEKIEAKFKDGVLTLTLPKKPEEQPKKIPIQG